MHTQFSGPVDTTSTTTAISTAAAITTPIECRCEGLKKIYYLNQETPCVIFAFSQKSFADASFEGIRQAKILTSTFVKNHVEAEAQDWTLDGLRCDSNVKGEDPKATWGLSAQLGYGVIVQIKTVDELIKRILVNINTGSVLPRKIDVVKVENDQLESKYKW